jgi:steroid delta-isomerase-like uncharacterized protein
MSMTPSALREAREQIVRKHIDTENRHEFAATVATFSHPRYEIVPTGDVHDGAEQVSAFFQESHVAFPDFRLELLALHHADEAVIVEVLFQGTQTGSWRGLPATGRPVRYRMCNVFVFEGDALVCERVYFDLLTALRQVGIARDPTSLAGRVTAALNHPIVIGRAMLNSLRSR